MLFLQKLSAMDDKIALLAQYNLWGGKSFDTGFLRKDYCDEIARYLGNRLVKVLVGQRRTGKSYILRQVADSLVKERKVAAENIFMLNKDLVAFDFVTDYKALNNLFQLYMREIHPKGKVYVFLDEAQNIDGWEKFANSYSQDYTGQYEVFVTGSNSKMLSGELATLLSGRYVKFEVMPFSFAEYAGFKRLPQSRDTYISYMREGGMPELLRLGDDEARRNYVLSLKDTILMRDIIVRRQIKDPALLEDLFVYLVNNTSTLFSVNSLVKYYKGRGKTVSYDKINLYASYMADAYLLHKAVRYDIRGKETLAGVCKYYANDPAFHSYLFRGIAHGMGHDLENLVYLALRRHGFDVYVGAAATSEVDFVAMKGDRIMYVQATYMLADETTAEREYRPLRAINDNYEKLVVSLDDIPRPSNKGILNIPAWELERRL